MNIKFILFQLNKNFILYINNNIYKKKGFLALINIFPQFSLYFTPGVFFYTEELRNSRLYRM